MAFTDDVSEYDDEFYQSRRRSLRQRPEVAKRRNMLLLKAAEELRAAWLGKPGEKTEDRSGAQ